jgi:hypothetical protein
MRFATDLAGDERLSNRWGTFLIRFVWPAFGLGSIPGFLISLAWWRPAGAEFIFLASGMFVLMPAYYWFVSRSIRWVWAGHDGLRISDGWSEIRAPYSDVEDVRGFWYARDLVRVALKKPTPVGRRFIFIPSFRLIAWGNHPVVNRLRERAGLLVT